MDYESDFDQGGGLYNPGCSHPWEISSSSSSTSAEWVFSRRDHTTPPPSRRRSSPPESPPRRRVTDIDRCDVSPQLMARGLRSRRGNSTTVTSSPSLRKSPRHSNCVVPTQPKASPKRAAPKPRPTGKQYVRTLRDQRSAARQHANRALKANRTKHGTKLPAAGKWVFIPKKREARTKPRRSTHKETATPSYLAAQATAVSMFVIFITVSVYTLMFAKRYMN